MSSSSPSVPLKKRVSYSDDTKRSGDTPASSSSSSRKRGSKFLPRNSASAKFLKEAQLAMAEYLANNHDDSDDDEDGGGGDNGRRATVVSSVPGQGWSNGDIHPQLFPVTREGRLQLYSANRRWIQLAGGWTRSEYIIYCC